MQLVIFCVTWLLESGGGVNSFFITTFLTFIHVGYFYYGIPTIIYV